MQSQKLTTVRLEEMKREKKKIVMVTAYDYPSALIAQAAGVDMILVGDSLGMVVLGYDSTLPVTMEDMIHHSKAVRRGATHTMVVSDLPFLSYHTSGDEAVRNAGRLLQEGMADAVKLEGGRDVIKQVKKIVKGQIPVMGHIGLTPQSVNRLGGYKVQGRDRDSAKKIIEDALLLEDAGCFSLVLECVPAELAELITERVSIPTIGIGAGQSCDGQVLVFHDCLGINNEYLPKFAKKYKDLYGEMVEGIQRYNQEVRDGFFPSREYVYKMSEEILEEVKKELDLA